MPALTLAPTSAFTSAWDDAPLRRPRFARRLSTLRPTEAAVRERRTAQMRPGLQRSALGEHLFKEVADALTTVCARHGVVITNFHVAPRFVDAAAGVERDRHEWWVELKSPGAARLDAGKAAVALDRELQRLSDDYEAKRKGGGLDPPVVRMLPEGTFERWRDDAREMGGQSGCPGAAATAY